MPSRRRFLKLGAAGLPLAAGLAPLSAVAGSKPGRRTTTGGPIVKPLPSKWFIDHGSNAEMRWDAGGLGYRIPNERFFVRNHTSTPLIDAATWRLRVFGTGLEGAPDLSRAVEFSYDELRSLPSHEIDAAIECAGNGRSYFESQQGTPVSGTPWTLGAIG